MAKTRVALIGLDYNTLAVGQAVRTAKDVEIVGNDKDRDLMKQAEMAKMVDKTDWNVPNTTDGAAAISIEAPPAIEYDVIFKAIAADALPKTLVATVSSLHSPALKAASQWLPRDAAFFSTTLVIHPDRYANRAVAECANCEEQHVEHRAALRHFARHGGCVHVAGE